MEFILLSFLVGYNFRKAVDRHNSDPVPNAFFVIFLIGIMVIIYMARDQF